ncbi:hypothetical protein HDIA_0119 [Hartmannibacter diazotrophicus]|uniref:Uncharacterized protein n=1 Tax=Hartmannibacter diazotrophicus TaxID=1482074 RepID=A0A2C9D073_9HYPH|nr:hypothetical protein [Hartmannibacter diazotrophicus]SON53660.1 hypothetical protein HDIA_0119 [Hartmannibacter diazotrophicus]
MTRRPEVCRLAVMAAVIAASAALPAGPAAAKVQVRTDAGKSIVAISGLTEAADCRAFSATGTIVDVTQENGLPRGMTFQETGREAYYVNLPELYKFGSTFEKKQVLRAYKALVRPGIAATIHAFACGAAGRIVKLDAISAQ